MSDRVLRLQLGRGRRMSWAKFDDLYDDNKKIKRAWRSSRGAVALHAMAITYCARHELDGVIDVDWLIDKLPKAAERKKILATLIEHKLFEIVDDEHYRVHDYLEYNQSRADAEGRRERDRQRKADAGSRGGRVDSKRNPPGIPVESEAPDPTRPDPVVPGPTPPQPPAAPAGIHPDLQAALEILKATPLDVEELSVNAACMGNATNEPIVMAQMVASWALEPGLSIRSASRLMWSAAEKLSAQRAKRDGIQEAAREAGTNGRPAEKRRDRPDYDKAAGLA